MATSRPALAGVRIVELAQFVFVPGGSAILADLGAEVIKVEPPGTGDPYRTLKIADGRQSASANYTMEQNNRTKKSVAIDLKSREGHDVFMRLIETADVFLTSIRPDTLERLGLGVEALRERNPKIIYVRGNGFGFRGEQANRAGFDGSAFWARGGFAHSLSVGRETLVRQRPAIGDHAGAANIAMGITTALFRRERTGEPSVVDVSLLSTAMWILSSDIVQSQNPTWSEAAMANVEFRMPLTRAYKAADGRWIQLMFLDPERYWAELCTRLGAAELAGDTRFATADLRAANGEALCAVLSDLFARRPYAEWEQAFADFDAPWEPVQSIREVAADPQAAANGYLFEIAVEDGTPVQLVAGPVSIDGSPVQVEGFRAPRLGEHTTEVLSGLGLAADRIDHLREAGAIQ